MLDFSIWEFSDLFWIASSIILGIVTFALPNIKLGAIYKFFPAYTSKEVDAMVAKIHAKVFWVSVVLLVLMLDYLFIKTIFWVFKAIGEMFSISWLVSLSHNPWQGIGAGVALLAALVIGIWYINHKKYRSREKSQEIRQGRDERNQIE